MIIRVQKSEINSILFACGLRDIEVDIYTDERSTDLAFVDVPVEENPSLLWYISKEVCERVQEEQDFKASTDSVFDLFKIKIA